MIDEDTRKIRGYVNVPEMLAGLAEECNELAHAALKLRRVYDGQNPTPVTEEKAIENLYSEVADVQLYMRMLVLNWQEIEREIGFKKDRWVKRLEEAHRGNRMV